MKDFSFREYTRTDRPYIFKSWLSALHRTEPFLGCRDRLFYPRAQKLLEHVIDSQLAKIMVVSPKDDPAFIAGFAVFWQLPSHKVLWWIHIRDIYRKMGLCTYILDNVPGKLSYVFDRKYKSIKLGKHIFKPRGYEYFPTLMFDALEIGVKNDYRN